MAKTRQTHLVTDPKPKISVVILTLNEEINIEDCLDSCAWSDDVHVVDSGSTDQTAALCQKKNVPVYVNPFESFGQQRNWAIDNVPIKHDWVFHLDADERFTPELVQAMDDLLNSDPHQDGFHVPHKFMFMGRWLKHSASYPTYQMRLFHKDRMRFVDYGHGQREADDSVVGILNTPYLHYGFSKGIYEWLDKHNRYSSLEALQLVKSSSKAWPIRELFSGDRISKRRAWKDLGYHLPFRPTLRWLITMFVLGAVLEGRAGRVYSRLITMYEQMITVKVRLLRASRAAGYREGFEADSQPVASTAVFDAQDLAASGAEQPESPQTPDTAPQTQPSGQPAAAPSGESVIQTRPEASPWTFREKLGRATWMLIGKPLFRISFHNWYRYRAWLLRCFGARIGKGVAIRPSVNIEVPWMLHIEDDATIGDNAILYSLGQLHIGKRSIVSQYSHLCAGTHDYTDHTFRLDRTPITLGDDVWIGADVFIGPGVNVGSLSVVGARASVYKDLPPKMVFVGNPAKPIKERELK